MSYISILTLSHIFFYIYRYKDGEHRSNAEKLINEIPVIEVPATVAVCDGGSGALGHPVEYIQLDTVSNETQICKYCGLRFKMGEVHKHEESRVYEECQWSAGYAYIYYV